MPEGPSLVILKEEISFLKHKKVTKAHGNAPIDMSRLKDQEIKDIKTWGKHLLICFEGFTVKIHLMMFGTYLINERKSTTLKLGLICGKDEVNFYTSQVSVIEGDINKVYDWKTDILAEKWSASGAAEKVKDAGSKVIADLLIDQQIFAGAGNIIKNEALYRAKVHPLSKADALPPSKVKALVTETRQYAFDFLKWKKAATLSKHWEAYQQKTCKRCNLPMTKKHLGEGKRVTFYCTNCQVKYPKTA